MLQLGTGRRASLLLPLALVAVGTAVLGALNVADARAMAPSWGQDLAFFHQIVHSAAHGGPWASPLLLEPQGFFEMVHTHLVLPFVVLAYMAWPRQEVLLVSQALFAALALWPAFRIAETAAIERDARLPALAGALAAVSLLLFGPFQAVGTCDFRPSVLFLPGILGVYAAAREDRPGAALAWAMVANLGRQEAPYLLGVAGLGLCLLPWGRGLGRGVQVWLSALRWRTGLLVALFAVMAFAVWVLLKPQMFFHFDPSNPPPAAVLAPEHLQDRWDFFWRVLRSGAVFGLASPTALLSGLPLLAQMARDGREWTDLVGATAHYHAPWMAFAMASALAGAMRWPQRAGGAVVGGLLMCVLSATAFPFPAPRQGPVAWRALAEAVPADARVAADYDTIHAVAGRQVLWNTAQLLLPDEERPLAFSGDWPLTLDDVDALLLDADTELARTALAAGWKQEQAVEHDGRTKLLLYAPQAVQARQQADRRRSLDLPMQDSIEDALHPSGRVRLTAEPVPGAYRLTVLSLDGGTLGPPLDVGCAPYPAGVASLIPAQLDRDAALELVLVASCAQAPGGQGPLRAVPVDWQGGRLVVMAAWQDKLAGLSSVEAVRRALGLDE